MRDLLSLADRLGSLAAAADDVWEAQQLREVERALVEAATGLRLVDDRRVLEDLITATCTRPGNSVVLVDLLGQTWVGYAGAGAYVARPPSRHHVLEAVAVRTSELWLSVAQLDPARFPMSVIHAPAEWPPMGAPTVAGASR